MKTASLCGVHSRWYPLNTHTLRVSEVALTNRALCVWVPRGRDAMVGVPDLIGQDSTRSHVDAVAVGHPHVSQNDQAVIAWSGVNPTYVLQMIPDNSIGHLHDYHIRARVLVEGTPYGLPQPSLFRCIIMQCRGEFAYVEYLI